MSDTSTTDDQQTSAAVAREYMEAMAARDLTRAAAMWEPGGIDNLVGLAALRAPEEVDAYFSAIFAAVPEMDFQIQSITAQGDRAVVHWRMRGTFDGIGKMMGLVPNGRALDIEGMDLLRIRDGRIVSNTAITNGIEMARQLAVMPPQDSLLEQVGYGLFNAFAPLAKALRRRSSKRRTR